MLTVSEKIGEWVNGLRYGDIPQEVVNVAKRSILDFLGVALAGSVQSEGRIMRNYLSEAKGGNRASVIGLGMKTSCVEAAFANGLIGHCLDYDDLLRPVAGAGAPHVTTVMMPAALAAAEKQKSSGKELVMAYVLGCEVTYRVGRGVDPAHYNSGWHSTGTEGIFGAAAAASKLMKLKAEQIARALGIACSCASGIHENFGTMTKPFHAGHAAANGVKASLLAKLGFTSSKTAFEGKAGFCSVLSKNPKMEEMTQNLGNPFGLIQVCLKFYPCCAGSHSAICAAIDLAKQHEFKVNDIEQVTVKVDPQVVNVVTYVNPKTALEGKFSFDFPIALALMEKRVVLPDFTDRRVRDGKIVALMEKIKVISTEELRPTDVMGRPQIVEVALRDGRTLAKRCDYFPGTPRNPLSEEDLLEKYRSCARLVLGKKQVEESIDLIMNLEKVGKIDRLMNLLRSRRKSRS